MNGQRASALINGVKSTLAENVLQTKEFQMRADDQASYGNSHHIAAASDLNDINVLVQNYRSNILRYAWSQLRDRDLAETVTQDCFLRAFRVREGFRGGCSVRTWLFTIATNLIRDYTRPKRFRFWKQADAVAVTLSGIRDRVPSRQQSMETKLLVNEKLERIWNIVDSLPQEQKEVFHMRFVEGMKLTEIAQVTGMTMSAIKTHLHRGVRTIRARMQDQVQPGRGEVAGSEYFQPSAPPICELESHGLVFD